MTRRNAIWALSCTMLCWMAGYGCSPAAPAATMPPGVETLLRAEDGDKLLARLFPGKEGLFFVATQGAAGSPYFGIVHEPEEPGRAFIAGAAGDRSWTAELPLESARMRVTRLKPLQVAVGDSRQDGTPELFLVLAIESEDQEGESRIERVAAYLFELGNRASLVWYQSLSASGRRRSACDQRDLTFTSTVDFLSDDKGRLDRIVSHYSFSRKKCEGGKGCEKEESVCERYVEDETVSRQWDDELRGYAREGATEMVLRVPDICL